MSSERDIEGLLRWRLARAEAAAPPPPRAAHLVVLSRPWYLGASRYKWFSVAGETDLRAILSSVVPPGVEVNITDVPPFDRYGGTDTRADIAGRITGALSPSHRVVVYARADLWYRQPTPYASVAPAPDGSWKTWTHTGSSYAAFVINRDAGLSPRLDILPLVGSGGVVARVIVDGVRR